MIETLIFAFSQLYLGVHLETPYQNLTGEKIANPVSTDWVKDIVTGYVW